MSVSINDISLLLVTRKPKKPFKRGDIKKSIFRKTAKKLILCHK